MRRIAEHCDASTGPSPQGSNVVSWMLKDLFVRGSGNQAENWGMPSGEFTQDLVFSTDPRVVVISPSIHRGVPRELPMTDRQNAETLTHTPRLTAFTRRDGIAVIVTDAAPNQVAAIDGRRISEQSLANTRANSIGADDRIVLRNLAFAKWIRTLSLD